MDKDLFARWLAFGMLSSHSRCHGEAPKEPWLYGDDFMNKFRTIDELKYKLMPYVYAQAKDSSAHGLPMVRALFLEFPQDPGSWLVDDEYIYGSSLLVAPLLHENETSRAVYLPPGTWIDYQSGKDYSGGWQTIEAGKIPEIILVRDGTVIPHIALAQSTSADGLVENRTGRLCQRRDDGQRLSFPAGRQRPARTDGDQTGRRVQTGQRSAGRQGNLANSRECR